MPAIPSLPTAPNPNSPSTFDARATAWVAALPAWTAAVNAAEVLDPAVVTQGADYLRVLGQAQFASGSAAAPGITFNADTGANTGFYWIAENTLGVCTGGVSRMQIDSSGNMYMGSLTTLSGMGAARIQTQGTTAIGGTWNFVQHTANAFGPAIAVGKTRGTAVDTYTIVQAADSLGGMEFWGADGSTMIRSALVQGYVIGTPAAGDVRGGVRIYTGSGANAVAIRMTVDATTITAALPIVKPSYTVGTLPSAATVGAGACAFVTDATATTFASTVVGGGANKVPVYSDGTVWKIG